MESLNRGVAHTTLYEMNIRHDTVSSRSSDPFYKVSNYIKWVTTSWTYSSNNVLPLCLPSLWNEQV